MNERESERERMRKRDSSVGQRVRDRARNVMFSLVGNNDVIASRRLNDSNVLFLGTKMSVLCEHVGIS